MSEREAAEAFDDFLDEVYGSVTVAGYTMDTSTVLRSADPIAYRQEFLDWLDADRHLFTLEGP